MTEACSIEREELKPCALCGKGLIATGLPIVWRFRAERIVIDLTETRRAAGLEMMMGPTLAAVMGSTSNFAATRILDARLLVCEPCALTQGVAHVALLEADDEAATVHPGPRSTEPAAYQRG